MPSRSGMDFSGEYLNIEKIETYHQDIIASIESYYTFGNPASELRFASYAEDDILQEKRFVIEEFERSTSMTLLAYIEAEFRIDFLKKCKKVNEDEISLAFRARFERRDIKSVS